MEMILADVMIAGRLVMMKMLVMKEIIFYIKRYLRFVFIVDVVTLLLFVITMQKRWSMVIKKTSVALQSSTTYKAIFAA